MNINDVAPSDFKGHFPRNGGIFLTGPENLDSGFILTPLVICS